MTIRALVILSVCIACVTTASCGSLPRTIERTLKELPYSPEPKTQPVKYSVLRGVITFQSTMSSADIASAIANSVDNGEKLEPYDFQLVDDHVIESNGGYFRRVLFRYYPSSCEDSYHGPCFQDLAVWLTPAGSISKVYVTKVIFPM
jgi:hypothetical protein